MEKKQWEEGKDRHAPAFLTTSSYYRQPSLSHQSSIQLQPEGKGTLHSAPVSLSPLFLSLKQLVHVPMKIFCFLTNTYFGNNLIKSWTTRHHFMMTNLIKL